MNFIDQKTLFKATNNMNEISKAMLENIEWIDKRRANAVGRTARYDVRVSMPSKTSHKQGSVNISFIPERIAGLMKGRYVKVAIVGDLFLFKAAEEYTGWKLYSTGKATSRVQIKISGNEVVNAWAKKNKGLYAIHYDANSDFYFINATEKGVY